MDPSTSERLSTEISLLEAMYPSQITWNSKSRELTYTTDSTINTSTFTLRLPDTYHATSLPSVLLASVHKSDVRDKLQESIGKTCPIGEECLDAVISIFDELSSSSSLDEAQSTTASTHSSSDPKSRTKTTTTVIIWLHHLLNQNKRKLALHPPLPPSSPSQQVHGLTKPGYPGVLIYSGPSDAVKEHVAELKGQKWAAFQVRLEEDGGEGEEWTFEHGLGIREVETMGELVKSVSGEERREIVCGVLGIK